MGLMKIEGRWRIVQMELWDRDAIDLDRDFAVVRFSAEGALDTTFGAGGKVLVDLESGSNDQLYSVTPVAGGGIPSPLEQPRERRAANDAASRRSTTNADAIDGNW